VQTPSPISIKQAVAYVTAFITVVVPLLVYKDYPALLGEHPTIKVIVVAAVGCAVTFVLCSKPQEQLWVVLPGLIVGGGAAWLYMALVGVARDGPFFITVLFIGALPGFLVMWVLRRFLTHRRGHSSNAA
jgi:hypothetical protein